jgi:ribosome-associated heat shock protein Hsp15
VAVGVQRSRPLLFQGVNTANVGETSRLDRWLWAVRIFKTRSLATDACRAGSVAVAGSVAKAARDVRVGEQVIVQQGLVRRTLLVRGHPVSRVGARHVAQFCDDQTPPEEFAKATERRIEQFLARERGSGRPTKRDRRAFDQLLGP